PGLGGVMKPPPYLSFVELKTLLRSDKPQAPVPSPKPVPEPVRISAAVPDNELFEQSMEDVKPLGWSTTSSTCLIPIEIPNPQESEDEGLQLLIDFVNGRVPIDVVVSGEYVEGAPDPRGRLWLESLRTWLFGGQ